MLAGVCENLMHNQCDITTATITWPPYHQSPHRHYHPCLEYDSYIGVQGGASLSFTFEQHVHIGRHPQHIQANHAQTLLKTVL